MPHFCQLHLAKYMIITGRKTSEAPSNVYMLFFFVTLAISVGADLLVAPAPVTLSRWTSADAQWGRSVADVHSAQAKRCAVMFLGWCSQKWNMNPRDPLSAARGTFQSHVQTAKYLLTFRHSYMLLGNINLPYSPSPPVPSYLYSHKRSQLESMLKSSMPWGFQWSPTPELKTRDQTYGMKKSSGWSSSTYLNFSSGNFYTVITRRTD